MGFKEGLRQEEEQALKALSKTGMFQKKLVARHKVLFTKTEIGRQVSYRHLAPHVLVDASSEIIRNIKQYVGTAFCVNATSQCDSAPAFESLEDLATA
jgi:hypothetical protein